jgi:glycosyltransferase involved in cell wall biosynthesis
VTVVTPALNRAQMLERTVQSIRAQSYPYVEHIVVDGGSTDGTVEMLRRHEGSYSLRWISEPDDGMYSAINKGLRRGSGDIQAYLNSDDLYFPWSLDVVVKAFARHPEVDVVFGDVLDIDDPTGHSRVAWNLPFNLDYLRRTGFMWQPGVFWRRSVFVAAAGFDERIRYGADLEFWLRLGAQGRRFLKVNEVLAVARQHPETLSLKHLPRVIQELAEIRAKHAPRSRTSWLTERVGDPLRRPLWTRAYWLGLIAQSVVPDRIRRGPWSQFLGAGKTRISYLAVLLRPIPGLGRRVAGPLLRPSRNWLNPPG